MTNVKHFPKIAADIAEMIAPLPGKKTEKDPPAFTGFLDKLAGLPQTATGAGSTALKFRKRAKAKYMTNSYLPALIELDSPLKKSYVMSLYCSRNLAQKGDKITTKYCKNRWCMVCNRIRTGTLINGYLPQLETLVDPQFVTLTIPNVPGSDCRAAIGRMVNTWRSMYNQFKREKLPVVGIRKTECTYNAESDSYHPHFHFIIEGRELATRIVKEWLTRLPECNQAGQDQRPATPGSVKELFKYFTKIYSFTKGGGRAIYIPALDVIFRAMRDRRVFQAFGIKAVTEDIEEIQAETIEGVEIAVTWWNWSGSDWIDENTGKRLTGYEGAEWVNLMMKNAIF